MDEGKRYLSITNAELLGAAFFFLFAIGIFVYSSTLEYEDSKIFPRVIGWIILISSVIQFYDVFKKHVCSDIAKKTIKRKELLMLSIMCAVYPLFKLLGFYTTLFLFSLLSTIVVLFPLNKKLIKVGLVYVIILIVFSYVCFALLLGLVTPSGVFI